MFLRFIVFFTKKTCFSELFFVFRIFFLGFSPQDYDMPGAGLEPAWKIRQILSLLRLPFRHPGAIYYKCSTAQAKVKSFH